MGGRKVVLSSIFYCFIWGSCELCL